MPDISFKEWCGVFGVIANLASSFLYITSILRGRTRPHLFSRLVWTLTTGTVFFTQIASGAGAGAWVSGCGTLVQASITVLSLAYGEKTITRGDWISLMAALSALPLWALTKNPLWSVIIVTLIDASAYYPTLRKSFSKPDEEPAAPYIISNIKHGFTLLALGSYSLTTTLYFIVMLLMNGLTAAFVLARRKDITRRISKQLGSGL